LYTPQIGERSDERLTPADRARVIRELRRVRPIAPKLQMFDGALWVYAHPPASPADYTVSRKSRTATRIWR
jgi:hypothetical protein